MTRWIMILAATWLVLPGLQPCLCEHGCGEARRATPGLDLRSLSATLEMEGSCCSHREGPTDRDGGKRPRGSCCCSVRAADKLSSSATADRVRGISEREILDTPAAEASSTPPLPTDSPSWWRLQRRSSGQGEIAAYRLHCALLL
ncbi:MAG: hypothetical protein ACE5GW_05550 [Planctomycetota bacterium]